ncbi:hypothetical protein FQN57_002932 [Myotisia sp. PD_48]|nr:hypothetical protein FQN57_002932 [Myotisia sp. PD_48]
MVDYRSPALQAPHRKPVSGNAGFPFHAQEPSSSHQNLLSESRSSGPHHRPRTASSSFLPSSMHPLPEANPVYSQQPPQQPHHQQQQQQYHHHQQQHHHHHLQQHQQPQLQQQQHHQYGAPQGPARRPSNATSYTASKGGNTIPTRQMTNTSVDIRRSSSSHSPSPQMSYVTLMRKQKATVWCDRAQSEDPRMAAQRRAAKQRALLEIHGGVSARTSTLISGGKIRHNTGGRSYNTSTMVGAGVPLRLSANEVGGADDSFDERDSSQQIHRRTGSGRSSAASSNRLSSIHHPRAQQTRFSSGSSSNINTPPSVEQPTTTALLPADTLSDIPNIVETPAPIDGVQHYFSNRTSSDPSYGVSGTKDRPTTSRSDKEDEFGHITDLAAPSATATVLQKRKTAEGLKRTGSVDDRTSTMTNVRLFIANPDLSD